MTEVYNLDSLMDDQADSAPASFDPLEGSRGPPERVPNGGNDRRMSILTRTGTLFGTGGVELRRTIGHRIRNIIYRVEDALGPILKRLIPNFIVAHYVYLISWTIFGSVVIFGQRNVDYIDALFAAAACSSQAGLNTIDLNQFKLYQQITMFVITMLTTPIFIHGSLVFLRLFWFEKIFDNIKEKSIEQFKTRRTMTIARLKTETMPNNENGRLNGSEWISDRLNQNPVPKPVGGEGDDSDIELRHLPSPGGSSDEDDDESELLFSGINAKPKTQLKKPSPTPLEHMSEPSDDDDVSPTRRPIDSSSEEEDVDDEEGEDADVDPLTVEGHTEGGFANGFNETQNVQRDTQVIGQSHIKFADLPKPSKERQNSLSASQKGSRRSRDINPRDLLMSISVLQQQPEEIESGPALKIKGPLDVERENKVPGYVKRRRLLKAKRKELKKQKKKTEAETKKKSNLTHHPFLLYPLVDSQNGEIEDGNHGDNEEFAVGNSDIDGAHSDNSRLDSDGNESSISDDYFKYTSPKLNKISSNFEHVLHKGKRRASFFARTLTGRHDDLDEQDAELISQYSDRLQNPNYLSWTPTIGRNSNFVTFSEEQKKELGGVEYQAMKLLSWLLILYYLGFHLIAMIFYLAFILTKDYYAGVVRSSGVSPTWWAFFTSQSAFNDLGYTLTPNSMVSFQQNAYIAIVSSFFIVIGNTGFPIFLRLIIWVLNKFARPLTLFKDSLTFLLLHPRRCFTLLFPSGPTWWLFTVLLIMNLTDWMLFLALDFNAAELASIPKGYRVVDGLFQSFSTRTAGFAIVDLASLHPAIKVSYMVMMYISVLPLAMSIRRTNVYEEQSLGVYTQDESDDEDVEKKNEHKRLDFIGSHLRRQLSFDLWFLFLAIFIVCICEGGKIRSGEFTIFDVMFEVTSAYGTVGLSMGYPGHNFSLCGIFTPLSKLVVIATMLRGRHRGLPNSIDRAILLNHDKMDMRDNVQSYTTMRRSQTANTVESKGSSLSWKKTGNKILKFVGSNLFSPSGDTKPPRRSLTREATKYVV